MHFHIEHCVSLRHTMYYFETFIYCNTIALLGTFNMLHCFSTILSPIFTTLYIQSLLLIYYLLLVCTLKHHQSYPLPPSLANHHSTLFFTGLTVLDPTYK